MADKEERIYIGIINPKGDFCPVPIGECNSLCDCCTGGMTKKEAIKAMAKRLEYEGVNKFECHTIAKWCLDELLEGVKKWK